VRRMKSTEIKMLHMICGKMVRDKVRNQEIHERTEVEEHLREVHLHWFDHMERTNCERPQSVVMNFKIGCSKKGRQKRWKEIIDVDMKVRGLKRSDSVDQTMLCADLAAETDLLARWLSSYNG